MAWQQRTAAQLPTKPKAKETRSGEIAAVGKNDSDDKEKESMEKESRNHKEARSSKDEAERQGWQPKVSVDEDESEEMSPMR